MRGIQKRFGATVALAGVSIEVGAGEVHALVGENGAGKSTLMKILSGAIRPDAGEMALDGETYSPQNPGEGRSAGVAMIYQELSLAPHLSVMENVFLGVEPRVGPFYRWGEARRRTLHALAEVGLGGPGGVDPGRRTPTLSPAQGQLVEIARSVAIGCRVLVLDEPTSSLTQRDVPRLFALIERLSGRGIAVIYISHFLEEVQRVSDRFTVLRDGRTVGGGLTSEHDAGEIVRLMVGRTVDELYPRSERTPGPVALRLDGLQGAPLPREASLELRRGEVLGVAGLMGAGRTQMLRAVFGLDAVRSGEVRVGRVGGVGMEKTQQVAALRARSAATPSKRWRQGLGMVSEDRKEEGLALGLSVAENLTLPRLPMFVTPAAEADASRGWIERLGIRLRSPHQPVSDLSGGNQQKVAIARLLHAGVDVLLLDEPTRGIDVNSKAAIYRLIDDLTVKNNVAVLMVSSYLPELLGVCDRIAVMHRGVLGPARAVGEVDEHSLMLEATGGGGSV